MKLLVPHDQTKGHKIASDIVCLHVTFSVAFHFLFIYFFYPQSTDRATERVPATASSVFPPLLPVRLSTKAVSGTKLQLSHITTQVRNAVLGGGWL